MRRCLFFILSLAPSGVAFFLVYWATDRLFQRQKFPYPFEHFGIAAGLGTAFWVYAVVGSIRRRFYAVNLKEKTRCEKVS